MKKSERHFMIQDINCISIVEIVSKTKDIFDWLDNYIDNLRYDWFESSDESFSILYKDGTQDYIDENYDGHKIKKQNIQSMIYNNPCTSMVYGTFEINEYGVVTTSVIEKISNVNIKEIPPTSLWKLRRNG